MGIKNFWKENKNGYLWSCLGLTLIVSFMGVIKNIFGTSAMNYLYLGTLASFPLMLVMAFGIYNLTGGDKK